VRQGEIAFNFMTWGSGSVNDASASVSYFFKGGPDDTTLDPQVIQALTEADSSVDAEVRQRAYSKALTRIMQEVYWVPMMSCAYYYAMAADLEFEPTPDEVTHLYTARWR
jgi:peptide/nickel transport system substrate-binding protein